MDDALLTRLRALAGELAGATFDYPFGPNTAVYRVAGKMFALFSEERGLTVKAPPELVEQLCADHAAVTPGYHMSKRHWVTIALDGSVPQELLRDLLVDAHALVQPGRR